jgi:DNA-binding transcriptional LysR family regulator
MIAMLQRMDLLALVPDYTVGDYVKRGVLKRVEYPAFAGRVSAGVIHLKDRHVTPALQTFIAIAKQVGAARYGRGARARST